MIKCPKCKSSLAGDNLNWNWFKMRFKCSCCGRYSIVNIYEECDDNE